MTPHEDDRDGFHHTRQERIGPVYRITIDRPEKKNALTPEVYRELRDGVMRASAMADVRVIVIAGQPGAFAVGGDLKLMVDIVNLPEEERLIAYSRAYGDPIPFKAMLDSPKPIVAKIDGLCIAGGLVLASVADIAVATERSTFGVPEGLVGLADPFCSSLLPLTIGLSRARYMMMTARRIDAATAYAWGIIQAVTTPEALDGVVDEIVDDLVRVSPESHAAYKQAANRFVPAMDPLDVCRVAFTGNGQEGLTAFNEKRPPRWTLS